MAYRLALDAGRRIARMTFSGAVDGDQLTEASARIVTASGNGPLDLVCDLRAVTALNLEPGDLDRLLTVKLDGPTANADPQRNVVLTHRSLDTLMAGFYQMLARRRGLPTLVCQTEAEACAWLGVPDLPDTTPP